MRRTHTKSRKGCTNCKRRKVKCDESYPACFNCRRRQTHCSLSDQAQRSPGESLKPPSSLTSSTPASEGAEPASGSSAVTPSLPPAVTGPSPAEQIAPYPPQELWGYDLELMHHYVTSTADTLSIRADMCHVWRVALPREGYQHHFVTHGMLAVAATHKAYLLPHSRKKYLALADYHQMVGSEGYRTGLQDINDANGVALFSFASTMVLLMLALPIRNADNNGRLENPMHHLMELASLHRGINTTLTPLLTFVLRTEFAPLLYGIWPLDPSGVPGKLLNLEHCLLPQDTWEALQRLRDYLKSEVPAASCPDYLQTLEGLEDSAKLIALAGPHVECGAVLVWLHNTPESVLLDIAAYRPHGLLVLAYYCVFWAALDKHFWYARTWPRQLFDVVEGKLMGREKFVGVLQWPRERLVEMRV